MGFEGSTDARGLAIGCLRDNILWGTCDVVVQDVKMWVCVDYV